VERPLDALAGEDDKGDQVDLGPIWRISFGRKFRKKTWMQQTSISNKVLFLHFAICVTEEFRQNFCRFLSRLCFLTLFYNKNLPVNIFWPKLGIFVKSTPGFRRWTRWTRWDRQASTWTWKDTKS
jgi:hypothetical protein